MARVIAITNQKGGVGKTTTAINLCAALAAAGRRSLLVDMDPQGNATVGSGLAMRQLEQGTYEVLLGGGGIDSVILATEGGYDIAPSHPDLSGAQVEMTGMERRDFRLADALTSIDSKYELIIIDCPPALNVLTVNALVAAREALIPVQCEYYALEGLTSLMQTIELIRRGLNPSLQLLGLVRTMYDARNTLSNEVAAQLNAHFPEQLFRAVIPRNVRLAEAPSHGKAVLQYDRQCAGSQAYVALAGEVLRRRAA
ncbi:MAG: ParA family protein [Gammaproteobacteria bacterium]